MATEDSRKLFMAGLPESVTEDALKNLFSEAGADVTEVSLPRDRATGRPRGFAFVRLGSEADAERARQSLDGRLVDGRPISVRPFHADPPTGRDAPRAPRMDNDRPPRRDFGGSEGGGHTGGGYSSGGDARGGYSGGPGAGFAGPGPGFSGAPSGAPGAGFGGPRGPRPDASPDRTLYVGNLPYDASVEDLETLFTSLGAELPARVYLPLDPDGRKRGFGFITMNSAEAATGALDALRDADLRGRKLILNIAHPKGERPAGERSGPPPGGGGGGGGGFRSTGGGGGGG
ncbi:MAG: RNA-binding protein, partial [Deltaproteobacteria bacterium]|nr:RNA-binding protein [Deltaproteobacteria bacterium]